MVEKRMPFGGLSIVISVLIIAFGFMYLASNPNNSMLATASFGAIALAAVVSYTLAMLMSMEINMFFGYFGGLVVFFVLLKILAGLP